MPAGMGEEERFAAAVEHGTIPAFLGRGDDDAGDLARELEIVALLRSGAPALGPDPAARERARQRLMAAFEGEFGRGDAAPDAFGLDGSADPTGPVRVVAPVALATRAETPTRTAEPTPPRGATALADRPVRRGGRHSAPEPEGEPEPGATVHRLRTRPEPAQRGGHRRAALLGAAAAAALVALAGGGTFASRDALPGDTMYGIKRVAESTGYALTFGEDAKARRHLEQAQRRLDEVEGMVARDRKATTSGAPAPSSDPDLVRSTMQEFDTDATEGSRLLLAGPTPNTAEVDEVQDWAKQQSARLSEIRSTLPAPDRADESLALLDRMLGQTEALKSAACAPGAESAGATPAPVDAACAPSTGGTATLEAPGTDDVPATQDGSTKVSGTAPTEGRSDDPDGEPQGADEGTPGATASVNTDTKGSGTSSGSSERRKHDDGSDGGGSGGSGGSGDVAVPLPVPATVDVPPVAGLPRVSVGR